MNAAEICYRSCPYQFNCDEFCHNYDPPFPHNLQHYVSPPSEAADYSTLLIIIFVIVISCLLLSCAVKCCSEDAASEDRTRQANNTEEDHDHTHNSIDHTGHARSVGLEESVISSIPVYKYKRGGGITKGTECPVCLNEYREGEDLRLLPLCNHAFHLPCIDTWLKSHTNCPSCRTSIVSNSVTVENSVSL